MRGLACLGKDSDLLLVYTGSGRSTSALGAGIVLGSAAVQNTGTSGANGWRAQQTLTANAVLSGSALDFHFLNDEGAAATYPFILMRSGYAAAEGILDYRLRPNVDNAYTLGNASYRWGHGLRRHRRHQHLGWRREDVAARA